MNWAKIFRLFPLIGGLTALVSAVTAIAANWSILTFNPSSLNQLYSTSNQTVQNYLQVVSQAAVLLQYALYLFAPIMVIAGAFMLLGFYYSRSHNHKLVHTGALVTTIFSVVPVIVLAIYLPINSLVINTLFGYLGASAYQLWPAVVYGTFMASVIIGLSGGILGLNSLAKSSAK